MKHEVHLSQGTIRYREDGTGEPLLFVHGVVVNGDLWRKVVPRLSKDFRCIVPDWPLGSHEIPMSADADLTPPGLAQLVVDFMDALGLETVTLVGNDTGGAICQLVAAEHPERISRLVLTSCDLYDRFPPPVFKPLAKIVKVPGARVGDRPVAAAAIRAAPADRVRLGHEAASGAGRDRLLSRPGRSSSGVRRDLGKVFGSVDARYTIEAAQKLESFDKPILLAWAGRTSCSRSSTPSGSPRRCRTARSRSSPTPTRSSPRTSLSGSRK